MACGLAPRRGPKLRTSCGAISTFYELLEPVRHHLIRLLAALLACAPPALMLADDRPPALLAAAPLALVCGKLLNWLLLRWSGEHSDLHLGTPSCRPWRRAWTPLHRLSTRCLVARLHLQEDRERSSFSALAHTHDSACRSSLTVTLTAAIAAHLN